MVRLLQYRAYRSLCSMLMAMSVASCGIPESGVPPVQVDTTPTALSEPLPSASPVVLPSADPRITPTVDEDTTPIPPTPTMALQAVVDARFYWDWGQAEEWRRQAQRRDIEEWLRRSYEEKTWMADQAAITQATAAARTPAPKIDATPVAPTEEPFPTGMFEGNPGAYRDSDFVVQNSWQGYIEGQFWQVYAGARGDDHRQGMLTVIVRGRPASGATWYETASPIGWIRVTSVDVPIVHLVAEDGRTLAFDLNKLEWVP
jgi:hypothetical protein